MRSISVPSAVLKLIPRWLDDPKMSPRFVITLIVIACIYRASTKPVRKTLNFNMFVLKPQQNSTERTVLAADGASRFGPILEYIIQRFQGLMSVKLPPDSNRRVSQVVPQADPAENEIDHKQKNLPGVVVRPSRTKPGTYEVEIDVVVDDDQMIQKIK